MKFRTAARYLKDKHGIESFEEMIEIIDNPHKRIKNMATILAFARAVLMSYKRHAAVSKTHRDYAEEARKRDEEAYRKRQEGYERTVK